MKINLGTALMFVAFVVMCLIFKPVRIESPHVSNLSIKDSIKIDSLERLVDSLLLEKSKIDTVVEKIYITKWKEIENNKTLPLDSVTSFIKKSYNDSVKIVNKLTHIEIDTLAPRKWANTLVKVEMSKMVIVEREKQIELLLGTIDIKNQEKERMDSIINSSFDKYNVLTEQYEKEKQHKRFWKKVSGVASIVALIALL